MIINKGKYMKNIPTMKDIAESLGVTVVTVSKALSDKEGVGEELRARIKAKAQEMGYKKNLAACFIKVGITHNIGIIVAERRLNSNTSYMTMQQPLITKLMELGYYGMMEIISTKNEKNLVLPKLLDNNKVDALIIIGQMRPDYINILKEASVFCLFLDFLYDEENDEGIVVDNINSGYTLTNYLLNRNITDIAFVGNIRNSGIVLDRYLGYYKALLETGKKIEDSHIINEVNDFGEEIDFQLPENLPQAFICNNCKTAYKLIHLLESKSVIIPERVSVVAFDEGLFAEIGTPKLTTFSVDYIKMAEMAAESIVLKLEDKSFHFGKKIINGHVISRESVSEKQKWSTIPLY